jgi:hypothetical protein
MKLKIKGSPGESSRFKGSEVTVVKARGNFRPMSTRIKLYQPD